MTLTLNRAAVLDLAALLTAYPGGPQWLSLTIDSDGAVTATTDVEQRKLAP